MSAVVSGPAVFTLSLAAGYAVGAAGEARVLGQEHGLPPDTARAVYVSTAPDEQKTSATMLEPGESFATAEVTLAF